jgi:hypothetical protein
VLEHVVATVAVEIADAKLLGRVDAGLVVLAAAVALIAANA